MAFTTDTTGGVADTTGGGVAEAVNESDEENTMPAKSPLAARLEMILPRKLVSVAIPPNIPANLPFTNIPGIAADLPPNPGTNMPFQPPSGAPTVWGTGPSGTFGNTGFGQPQPGTGWVILGNVLGGNAGPSSQGVDPSQSPGAPPDVNVVPSGGQGYVSQPGDYPGSQGPEEQAGQEDPGSPEPEGPDGPTAVAFNPEGDYGRGGMPPGVIIGGPGTASYDPEGGGASSGTTWGGPGVRDPRGAGRMPNPEGGGPTGPAAAGARLSMGGMTSLGRLSAGAWLGGLTSSLRGDAG